MEQAEPGPVGDDELIYRRMPAAAIPQRYDSIKRELSDQAFAPHSLQDVTGISVTRAKFKPMEQAAVGWTGKSYYIAVLRAADIRKHGMSVVPRPIVPDGYDLAHAEIPELNSTNRKASETLERQRILARICIEVCGPFATK